MMLCYSRKMYVEFTLSRDLGTVPGLSAKRVRVFWRRRPAGLMIDNLKTAVLSHPAGQPAIYHPRYLDFARFFGVELRACNVRAAHEKGRVERAVGYVKQNFLARLYAHLASPKSIWPAAALARGGGQCPCSCRNQRDAPGTFPRKSGSNRCRRRCTMWAVVRRVARDPALSDPFRRQPIFGPGGLCGQPAHVANLSGQADRSSRAASRGRTCCAGMSGASDVENPDHVRELLEHRKRAREQNLLARGSSGFRPWRKSITGNSKNGG